MHTMSAYVCVCVCVWGGGTKNLCDCKDTLDLHIVQELKSILDYPPSYVGSLGSHRKPGYKANYPPNSHVQLGCVPLQSPVSLHVLTPPSGPLDW